MAWTISARAGISATASYELATAGSRRYCEDSTPGGVLRRIAQMSGFETVKPDRRNIASVVSENSSRPCTCTVLIPEQFDGEC